MQKQKINVPVVLIIFNRPHLVEKQMEQLKRIQPPKLFIISDGARINKECEEELVHESRRIAEAVSWECVIEKIYAEYNMGCDDRIVSGLNSVFSMTEEAIILEDDCLPNDSFFVYCQEMLYRYKNNKDIMYISGSKWAAKYPMKYSYGFSYNTGTWGWATWSRAWSEWHWDIKEWEEKKWDWLKGVYSYKFRKNWIRDVEFYIKKGKIPWDYVWRFCVGKRMSIFPSVNFIKNIGFGSDATHTTEEDYGYDSRTYELERILHPLKIAPDRGYPRAVEKQYRVPILYRLKRKMKKIEIWFKQVINVIRRHS